MKQDKLTIHIKEDGSIVTETDKVSLPNHSLAENFLSTIARLAGGLTTRKARLKGALHNLLHGSHEHTHSDGSTHSH